MNNGVGQWLFTAQRIDVLLLGIGFTAATLFYLSVEILRYPLAHTPTLGKWRWMRFGWIMLFLLIGAALLASPPPYGSVESITPLNPLNFWPRS